MGIFISYLFSWWLSQTVESWTEKAVDGHDRLQLKFSILSMLQMFSHPYGWPYVVLFHQRTLNGLIDLTFQRIIDFSWCSQTCQAYLLRTLTRLAQTIVYESSIWPRAQLDMVVIALKNEHSALTHIHVYLSSNPCHLIQWNNKIVQTESPAKTILLEKGVANVSLFNLTLHHITS